METAFCRDFFKAKEVLFDINHLQHGFFVTFPKRRFDAVAAQEGRILLHLYVLSITNCYKSPNWKCNGNEKPF